MKKLMLSFGFIVAIGWSGFSALPIYDQVNVIDKYNYRPGISNTLLVSSPFANPNLDHPEDLYRYQNAKIKKITYLYSQNNVNPTFNQNQLSDDRYDNLLAMFPQIVDDQSIEWETLVQSGCGDITCAKQLYHGFIIEFEEIPTQLLDQHNLKTEYYNVSANSRQIVTTKSGTTIEIPANAFVRKDGGKVNGEVYIGIKEGVEVEDIVLGNLTTMTADHQVLESGGMIEITAYSEGYPLELKRNQSLNVHLNGAEMKDGVQLYSGVNTENGLSWEKPKNIQDAEIVVNGSKEANEQPVINFGWEAEMVFMKYPIRRIQHSKSGKAVTDVTLLFMDNEVKFDRVSYTPKVGIDAGLNEFQANHIATIFKNNNNDVIPLEFWGTPYEVDIEVNDTTEFLKQDGVWLSWNFVGNSVGTQGFNSFQEDNDVRAAFQVSNLGWANIDRLANFPNSRLVEFAVNVDQPDSLSKINISLVIPSKKMYLPGYEKKDGNYSFTHGDFEKHTLPVGDKAFIIAICEEDGETWFDIQEITLGENELESLALEKTDRSEAIALIKGTI